MPSVRPIIYVAGPYSDPDPGTVRKNVQTAQTVGRALLARGWSVIIPHAMYRGLATDGLDYETVLSSCLSLVRVCDALFFINPSPGADRERITAVKQGIRIYYKIEDVPFVE